VPRVVLERATHLYSTVEFAPRFKQLLIKQLQDHQFSLITSLNNLWVQASAWLENEKTKSELLAAKEMPQFNS
jgi:hypothetical protein